MSQEAYDLKLIDLLSLQPGAVLQIHAVRGAAECSASEAYAARIGWRDRFSQAIMPDETPGKVDNLSKLLDVPIETQVLVRHEDGKVVELIRLAPHTWRTLLERAGHKADIMVDGRIIAQGEIVDGEQSGVLIHKVVSTPTLG